MLKFKGLIPVPRHAVTEIPNPPPAVETKAAATASRSACAHYRLAVLAGERKRQACVESYGLAGADTWHTVDPRLQAIVRRAQLELGTVNCAVNFLDAHQQWSIMPAADELVSVIPRSTSICQTLLSHNDSDGIIEIPDTALEPLLADNPWVHGDSADIRFYAIAPLVAAEGWVLGTVCVWSGKPGSLTRAQRENLITVRDDVMLYLQWRREFLPSTNATSPLAAITNARSLQSWSIDRIIDERAIRVDFQPVVELRSGAVVGFEALSRGPRGSALELPDSLFEAARQAGRVGELDWLCRVFAMNAASRAHLSPDLSWLLNVEPAGLDIECPPQLRQELDPRTDELRIILEVVERDVEGHVTELLHAADKARRDSWGIALDDVGAEDGSLALLPFLRPDVVKLDMSLLHQSPTSYAAAVTAAVRAYAERTGAVILAEGIETEDQERLALVFGATYGQGFRYGSPGELPATVPTPHEVIPLRQRLEPLATGTPFELLAATNETHRASKFDLLHISHHLEEQSAQGIDASVLLAGFQDRAHFTPMLRDQYEQLSVKNTLTVVLANGLDWYAGPRYQTAPLDAGSGLSDQWVVIVINPYYSAAFVARDCGDVGPDLERRFDFIYTHDRDEVVLAARAFLQELPITPGGDDLVR